MKKWEDLPLQMQTEEVRRYYNILCEKQFSLWLKRGFDIVVSMIMMVCLSWLFLILAVAIKLDSQGPVFYRQERVTRYGKRFRIHKFRTMVTDADQKGALVTTKNDSRVTKVGRVLRKYRLDEISQLIDVFLGDMTFVGTRPEVVKYVEQYEPAMWATLLLPAGVTSEASILYKDEEKLLDGSKDVDKIYVKQVLPGKMYYNLKSMEKFSIWGEIATMFRTFFAVCGKEYSEERKEKPLIALLTNNDDDIYCFRKELIDGILEEGYEMLISCPYGEKFELMQEYSYLYDDPEIDRRGTNVVADAKLLWHYIKLFRTYRPDVVLTYTAKPGVYGSIAAQFCKIPYINNVTGFGSVLNQTGVMRKFIMGLFRFAYSKAECVMFQNETNMKLAKESGMVKGACKLIPGSGVALERYPLQLYPEGGDGKQGETIRFNYIGRILHDKGVDDYIACAKQIREKYPKTEFHMLGFIEPTEAHYEKDLKDLEEQGIVCYHGSQKDVRPFIQRAHAIIHPSTYGEGMSNVLLENASSGRPLITTDNPGCKETADHGSSGFIYPGGNVEALVKTVEQFLAMPNEARRCMGEKGREKVEHEFSRAIVVASYLETIKNILTKY